MRLNQAIEHISHLVRERAPADTRHQCGATFFEKLLAESAAYVEFEFGDIADVPLDEVKGLQDYGTDLMRFGKFALSFEKCSYSYRLHDKKFCAAAKIIDGGEATFPIDGPVLQIVATLSHKGRIDVFGIELSLSESATDDLWCTRICGLLPYQKRETLEEWEKAQFGSIVKVFVSMTCMLDAKGIKISVESTPEKLNKAGARKGKPPIGELRIVSIKVGEKTYAASGKETGTHASPRLHWRRGHIRRLPSGQITNVRPCLVGDAESGLIVHDHYAVQRV
jgi:hypothetical protein